MILQIHLRNKNPWEDVKVLNEVNLKPFWYGTWKDNVGNKRIISFASINIIVAAGSRRLLDIANKELNYFLHFFEISLF